MPTTRTCAAFVFLVVVSALFGCTEENKNFCTEATECKLGAECNLITRNCEVISTEGQFAQLLAPTTKLDLLFVIDNSGSMREEQEQLAADIEHLFARIQVAELRDTNIGIVSTDMGAGSFGIIGCDSSDDGQLQNTPDGECQPPSEGSAFITARVGLDSTFTGNFVGTPEETFACISRLGIMGCGFEQPLASVERALRSDNPGNAGFSRVDSFLAVVHLSDEDDCSAKDDRIYDANPALDNVDSELGPLSSYRCFDFGVTCNETDPDPRVDRKSQGTRTGCKANNAGTLLKSTREHAQYLRDLKGGLPLAWTAVIAGPINGGAATVSTADGEPVLEHTCMSNRGDADPAFRLASVAAEFGLPAINASVCDDSYRAPLEQVVDTVSALMSGTCLAATPRDIDSRDGLQTDCHIFDISDGGRGAVLATMRECVDDGLRPCFSLETDTSVCPRAARMRVKIDRKGIPVPQGSAAVLRCTAD